MTFNPWSQFRLDSFVANAQNPPFAIAVIDSGVDGNVQFRAAATGATVSSHSVTSVSPWVDALADMHGTKVVSVLLDTLPQATVHSICAWDTAGFTDINIASAVSDAVNLGCQVINLSLGSNSNPCGFPLTQAAIADAVAKGRTVISAAGNVRPWQESFAPQFPGAAHGSICVGAHDMYGHIMPDTARGYGIEFLAPGQAILPNWPGRWPLLFSHTSCATAFVSAAAAAIGAVEPQATPAMVRACLRHFCIPGPYGGGHGILSPRFLAFGDAFVKAATRAS